MANIWQTSTQATGNWQPSDYGLLAWSFDPVSATTSTAMSPAGTLQGCKIHVPVGASVTNIIVAMTTAGSGLTSGQCFAALYKGGNLLGVTADQSTNWVGATIPQIMPIAGGPLSVASGDVDVVFWYNGTTGPTFARAAGNVQINANLTNATSRFFTANTSITTTAPGSLTGRTSLNTAWWAALS